LKRKKSTLKESLEIKERIKQEAKLSIFPYYVEEPRLAQTEVLNQFSVDHKAQMLPLGIQKSTFKIK
jgi:hypothetical protein